MGALDDTATAIDTLVAALNQAQTLLATAQAGIDTARDELLGELGTTTDIQVLLAARATIDAVQYLTEAANHLRSATTSANAFATALGILSSTTATTGTGASSTPVVRPPAGRWETPDTPRHYGDPFNQEYEEWVRTSTGGPPDQEYLVEHNGERAWFDAAQNENRNGTPTETLIDAKGHYAQFLIPGTESWKDWWEKSKSGLNGMMETAGRQVRVADGRPVEWWCAEENTADALNEAFDDNAMLNGRISACYAPMPDEEE